MNIEKNEDVSPVEPDLEKGKEGNEGNKEKTQQKWKSRTKDEALKEIEEYTLKEKVVNFFSFLLGCIAIATVVSHIIKPSKTVYYFIYLMAFCLLLLSMLMAHGQRDLVNIVTLSEVAERIFSEVNRLAQENKRLKEQIILLERSAGRLEELEGFFEKTTKLQIKNVKEFADQVKMSRKNRDGLATSTENKVFSFIIDAALKYDADGNDELDDGEVSQVIDQVKDIFGESIVINHERFREVVNKNRRISSIMTEVSLMQNEERESIRIFEIK